MACAKWKCCKVWLELEVVYGMVPIGSVMYDIDSGEKEKKTIGIGNANENGNGNGKWKWKFESEKGRWPNAPLREKKAWME